jgi:hypothetical protein
MSGYQAFISYRRADASEWVEQMYRVLAPLLGPRSIFRDIDAIAAGENFKKVVVETIPKCKVFFCVIGPQWTRITDGSGHRRLDQPADLVRIEVEVALSTHGLLIVPVLVDGAGMPIVGDLPPSLAPITEFNAAKLRSGSFFSEDVDRLIRSCDRQLASDLRDVTLLFFAYSNFANARANYFLSHVKNLGIASGFNFTIENGHGLANLKRLGEASEAAISKVLRSKDVVCIHFDWPPVGNMEDDIVVPAIQDMVRIANPMLTFDQGSLKGLFTMDEISGGMLASLFASLPTNSRTDVPMSGQEMTSIRSAAVKFVASLKDRAPVRHRDLFGRFVE